MLAALESSRLVRKSLDSASSDYTFHHSLIHEVAYRSLLRGQRERLHGVVATVLEAMYEDQLELVARELANHFDAAGEPSPAFHFHLMAAEQDLRLHAHQEALLHFDRALELLPQAGNDDDAFSQVYIKRGRSLELSGRFTEALANYDQMEAAAEGLDRPADMLRARLQQAILFSTGTPVSDMEKGVELARDVLERARALDDHEAEARALWIILLVNLFSLDHLEEAVEAGERALELLQDSEDIQLRAMVANDLGSGYTFLGELGQAEDILTQARDMLKGLDNIPMLTNVLGNQMIHHSLQGNYEQALALSDEGFELSERIGNLWGQACSLLYIDMVYADLGDYQKAIEAGSQCLRLGSAAGFAGPSVIANSTQAWVRGQLGQPQQGLEFLGGIETHFPPQMNSIFGLTLGVQAMLQLAAGDIASAEETLARAEPAVVAAADFFHPFLIFTELARVMLLFKQGQHERSLVSGDQLLARMRRRGFRLLTPDVWLLCGKSALALGDSAQAARLLDEAIRTARSMGSQRTLWRLLAVRGEVYRSEGESDLADDMREQAKAIVRPIIDNIKPLGFEEAYLEQAEMQQLLQV